MIWQYERKEVQDKRFDAYLAEMAEKGWELVYVRRGKETRVARDPDFWEVIWKRPKTEADYAMAGQEDSRESKGYESP